MKNINEVEKSIKDAVENLVSELQAEQDNK